MIVSRHPLPQRRCDTCEAPNCREVDRVSLGHGVTGRLGFFCDDHRQTSGGSAPTRASKIGLGLGVSTTLMAIGAAEASVGLGAAWLTAAGSLAPEWSASAWSGGVSLSVSGLMAFAFFLLVDHVIEAWLR